MAKRILVIEDNDSIRKITCEFLRKADFEIDEANDGTEAVELLNKQRFDLVISDFVMPRMNGFRVVEHVHSTSPETPVIFVSAYLPRKSAETLLRGMAEFIEKPFALDDLLSMVHRLLGTKSKVMSLLWACYCAPLLQ